MNMHLYAHHYMILKFSSFEILFSVFLRKRSSFTGMWSFCCFLWILACTNYISGYICMYNCTLQHVRLVHHYHYVFDIRQSETGEDNVVGICREWPNTICYKWCPVVIYFILFMSSMGDTQYASHLNTCTNTHQFVKVINILSWVMRCCIPSNFPPFIVLWINACICLMPLCK